MAVDNTGATDNPTIRGVDSRTQTSTFAVECHDLDFSYPDLDGKPKPGIPPVVKGMNLRLPRGSLCLLVGPNGAGKTTLLKVLAGKHMIPESAVHILGSSPFHDMGLTMSGRLSYIGGNWERDIAFAGYKIPLTGDFPAARMLDAVPNVDPERKARIIRALDVNPRWRMHRVSDGQRRRVQIAVGLLNLFDVLLLDEVTVDLDVLGRAALMRFLRSECEERGATVIYCTHIFDGLEAWPTHLMYVANGRMEVFAQAKDIPEMRQGRLLELVASWLKKERDEKRAREKQDRLEGKIARKNDPNTLQVLVNNGYSAGRMNASIKLASNAVMRM